MTITTRNEAAEHNPVTPLLTLGKCSCGDYHDMEFWLAAERRAMVQRLGQTLRDADMALKWSRPDRAGLVSLSDIAAILDEEAAR